LDFAENECNRIAELVRIGIEQAMLLDRLQKDEKAAQDIKVAEKKAAEKISEDIKASEKKAAEKISEDIKAAEKKAAEKVSEDIKADEQLIGTEVQTVVDTGNAPDTAQKICAGKRHRTASPANEFPGSTRSYETYKHMVRLPSESSYPNQEIPEVFRENSNHTVLYNSATCIVFFFLSRLTV
jgi:membrane protein involved in colicin uptake